MFLLDKFKSYLASKKKGASKITIKNYLSDVRKFITWFESEFEKKFNTKNISFETITLYKSYLSKISASKASSDRYISSLKCFFGFLKSNKLILEDPFDHEIEFNQLAGESLLLNNFRLHLLNNKLSKISIKNYLMDLRQFFLWLEIVRANNHSSTSSVDDKIEVLKSIDEFVIDEYKERLFHDAKLSAASINRKLSSIRKYLSWIEKKEIKFKNIQDNKFKQYYPYNKLPNEGINTNPDIENIEKIHENSNLIKNNEKPVYKNIFHFLIYKITDFILVIPILFFVEKTQYLWWIINGKNIFEKPDYAKLDIHEIRKQLNLSNLIKKDQIHNIPKSVYAPLSISIKSLPRHKRIYFHIRNTRPKWYKIYHTYPFSNYLHLGILIISTFIYASILYNSFFADTRQQSTVFASPALSPPKNLSFQGKLTDEYNNPITSETALRFSLYNDRFASGSAMKWQEVQTIIPDRDGKFTTIIGKTRQIPAYIFTDNPSIYLGMTVGLNNELKPRQQIATTSLTSNSEKLQGLLPITNNGAGTNNVVLALDSAGNLTIGGKSNPIFQASGGKFTLSGKTLNLITASGSDTSIVLNPDGLGIIDLQKPLQNTSNYNNISTAQGAVEIDDIVAILATSSGQSALTINQNSTGPIISASVGGIARFSLDNEGSGIFAGNLSVNGYSISSANTTFKLLNENIIDLNLAGNATSVLIGSSSGSTTVNNTLISAGGLTISPNRSLIVSGNIASNLIPFITGTYDLGSENAHWKNAFIDNLYTNSTATVSGFWQRKNGAVSPTNTSDDIIIGANQNQNTKFQIYGSGPYAATASTSGQLSFTTNSQANLLNNSNFAFYNSISGNNGINTANPALFIASNGHIGIGTNNPTSSLKVNGDIRGETFYAVNTTLQSADVAENYVSSQDLEPGDIVSIEGNDNNQAVIKTTSPYESKTLGVVSTKPGITLNENPAVDNAHPFYYPLALTGRVPVKVTSENGSIEPGDFITASSFPGIGMKATGKGTIIGKALESYSNSDKNNIAKIMVFIDLSYNTPQDSTGYNEIYNQLDKFKYILDTISDGFLQVKKIVVDSLEITTENVTIGGQSLKDYITKIIDERIEEQINTKLSAINLVNPLASGSAAIDNTGNASSSGIIQERIAESENIKSSTNSAIFITNITNIYNIASSSAQGASTSADFNPTLISSSSASPSIASNSAYQSSITITPSPTTPTPSQILSPASAAFDAVEGQPTNQSLIELLFKNLQSTENPDISSLSAMLSSVPNLNTRFGSFTKGMMVFGPTTLSDVAVAGNLNVGGSLILADNSINTIGSSLQLQPLRQGNLEIMGKLVTIDTGGNLKVSGNAQFAKNVEIKGKLAVNLIAPVPDSDLIIKLGPVRDTQSVRANNHSPQTTSQQVLVKNSSGSGVLAINQLGDIIASGSGAFSKIAANTFNIVRGAQADTSLVETTASSSAGIAVITPHETERTIISPYVNSESLIYLTAVSDTQGLSPYIARQTENSFTIAIPNAISKEIKINWWVIN